MVLARSDVSASHWAECSFDESHPFSFEAGGVDPLVQGLQEGFVV
jgi:hypothetical protein